MGFWTWLLGDVSNRETKEDVFEKRICDHEWEEMWNEKIYPNNLYTVAETEELFAIRDVWGNRTCEKCGKSEQLESYSEKLYLSVDRTEPFDKD